MRLKLTRLIKGKSMFRRIIVLSAIIGAGCSRPPEATVQKTMSEAERLYREGTALLDSDPERAVKLLTESLEAGPDAPPALYNRAVAYARLGRDAEAVADIDRLEKVEPKLGAGLREEMRASAEPYTDIAKDLFNKKDYRGAIKKCDSAIAYAPKFGDAWVVKGLSLRQLGDMQKAMDCLNKAIEVESNNYWAYLNRAAFHHEQKELQKALADYSKLIELRPRNPDGYEGRSAVYSDLKMKEKAKADTDKAVELRSKATGNDGK